MMWERTAASLFHTSFRFNLLFGASAPPLRIAWKKSPGNSVRISAVKNPSPLSFPKVHFLFHLINQTLSIFWHLLSNSALPLHSPLFWPVSLLAMLELSDPPLDRIALFLRLEESTEHKLSRSISDKYFGSHSLHLHSGGSFQKPFSSIFSRIPLFILSFFI